MGQPAITIDKSFIKGMKKCYDDAVKQNATGFTYDGHEFVTAYAKYFLQYYGPKFGLKFDDLEYLPNKK